MKRLYLIGGTMGVGKTTLCQNLNRILPNSIFLDGDWCWYANPFQVTEETKAMALDNVCYILNNFLRCTAYDNIIFCWVMHKQSIIDAIISRLDAREFDVRCISLMADEETLKQRLTADIAQGLRAPEIINYSIARLSLYERLKTIKVNTSGKSVREISKEILEL